MDSATRNAHSRCDVVAALATVIPYVAVAVASAVADGLNLGDSGMIVYFGFEMKLLVAFDSGSCSGSYSDCGSDPDPDPDALLQLP